MTERDHSRETRLKVLMRLVTVIIVVTILVMTAFYVINKFFFTPAPYPYYYEMPPPPPQAVDKNYFDGGAENWLDGCHYYAYNCI